MEEKIKQQGNQADKLLPDVYKELRLAGKAPRKVYALQLSENDTVLLNAGIDITVAAKGVTSEYDELIVKSANTEYVLHKTTSFNSSSVFSAVMSLNARSLSMLIGFITSDSVFLQVCELVLDNNIAIILDIGDSAEIKKANLALLKGTGGHFFTSIDYGYGVGTFQPGVGGFAHVTTAYGIEVFYDILSDGSVTKNESYIKPNEPYTVELNASDIGIVLTDIKATKVHGAGELIITGSTGMITYTRAADSTESAIYFTDNRKDGKLAVLTYSIATKTITASII